MCVCVYVCVFERDRVREKERERLREREKERERYRVLLVSDILLPCQPQDVALTKNIAVCVRCANILLNVHLW